MSIFPGLTLLVWDSFLEAVVLYFEPIRALVRLLKNVFSGRPAVFDDQSHILEELRLSIARQTEELRRLSRENSRSLERQSELRYLFESFEKAMYQRAYAEARPMQRSESLGAVDLCDLQEVESRLYERLLRTYSEILQRSFEVFEDRNIQNIRRMELSITAQLRADVGHLREELLANIDSDRREKKLYPWVDQNFKSLTRALNLRTGVQLEFDSKEFARWLREGDEESLVRATLRYGALVEIAIFLDEEGYLDAVQAIVTWARKEFPWIKLEHRRDE